MKKQANARPVAVVIIVITISESSTIDFPSITSTLEEHISPKVQVSMPIAGTTPA